MKGIWFVAAAMAVAVASLGQPAGAARLDCGRPATPDAAAVCRDPELSAMEGEMAGLGFALDALPASKAAADVRHDQEQLFLSERQACETDAACIGAAYRTRLAAIQDELRTGLDRLDVRPAPDLPPPVAAAVADYAERCHRLGGDGKAEGRPQVVTGDFDEDGVDDYLLDTRTLDCGAAGQAFCGKDGCRIDIAVSSEKFRPITATGGQPELAVDGIDVAISVPDSACPDLQDGRACWLTYNWQDGRRVQRYEARPRSD
jgi:hypothetical protein